MKTIIHSYYFDTRNASENAAYIELAERLKNTNGECFETWGGNGSHHHADWDGKEIELDTSSLFNNQWNTAPGSLSDKGYRVFDWAQDYPINFDKRIKRGHYLDITPEMREVRRNTVKCRYCGKMEPAAKGYVFCPHCRASEYLKKADLHLTRMKAIDDNSDCAPLTDAEAANLIPLWEADQLTGNSERGKARMAKARQQVEARYKEKLAAIEADRTIGNWCLDHGFLPEIAIYYGHTGRVTFGWNKPIDAEQLSRMLACVSECPFPYEIKCADGKTIDCGY